MLIWCNINILNESEEEREWEVVTITNEESW